MKGEKAMPVLTSSEVLIRQFEKDDQIRLEDMYDSLVPAPDSLGLPPRDAQRRRPWLKGLQAGLNLVAIADGKIIGHLAMLPSGQSAEIALFVREEYRRRGIATALARQAVERARADGLRFLWVLIASDNHAAHAGLLKFGFHTAWESLGEVQLVFRL